MLGVLFFHFVQTTDMASDSTTRIEAINSILSATGDSPVSSLGAEAGLETLAAEHRLDVDDKEVQAQGWYFNTFDRTYTQDVDGNIFLPPSVLYISGPRNTRYAIRAGKVFDLLNDTFTFTGKLTLQIIEKLPFEDLPEVARQYVVALASRRYADRQLTDPTLSRAVREDEGRAYSALRKAHMRAGNYSVFTVDQRASLSRGGPVPSRYL